MLNDRPDKIAMESSGGMLEANQRLQKELEEKTIAEKALEQKTIELERAKKEFETANERLKEALKYSEKMKAEAEEASAAKSRFLTNMSHEIRTPMNGVIGFTSLLDISGLNASQRELNSMVQTSADHLLHIINDILDFSKIESGRLSIEKKPFYLLKTVKMTIDTILSTIQSNETKIALRYSSNIGYESIFLGDAVRFEQILANLLSNAVKFTRQGSVEVCVREINASESISTIELAVEDNGIGIPSERFEEIFQSFRQLDESYTKKYGGTGLGLSIVKSLAEMMGGKISVKSSVGKGSVFTVELPLEKCFGEIPQPDITNKNDFIVRFEPPLNLLLIEDDTISLKLTENIAQYYKWNFQSACDGIEGFKTYQRGDFDIILMDVQLPELSGYEVIKIIRNAESNSEIHTPIIAVTAYSMAGDREKFLAAGADEYISKPFNKEELYEKVIRLVKVKRKI